jgi:hypothetical protein
MFGELAARINFWWAKKSLVEDRDFKIDLDASEYNRGIVVTFLTGKFQGVKVEYSHLRLRENDNNGSLDFTTRVLENPTKFNLENNKAFVRLVTNAMRVLVLNCVRRETDNEHRADDTSESDEERKFYEEDTSVLEERVSKRASAEDSFAGNAEVHQPVQPVAKRKRSKTVNSGKVRPQRKRVQGNKRTSK